MLVLALDTATPAVTAGVVALDGDALPELLAERVTVDPRAHTELLTPHLTAALDEAGVGLDQLDAIVCGSGPGPFTGLRVGMVTAAALGQVLNIPVHPVSTLDAIAFATPFHTSLLVVTDARRREVYWSVYCDQGWRVAGPHVDRPDAVAAKLADELADIGITEVSGPVAEQHAELFGLTVLPTTYPTPTGLVGAAARELREGAEPAPLTPLYLRQPDAVEPGARKRVSQA
ncbi:tRNA (adenosine(37)-N6)-threonylcarbamoyltransferase complex dimerization subunit type 1 TsaB [Allokutzneria sp. NRRL B-24872]|uniref:tRNA (adenosine(37)-N6)-threonylcarbamoyltransferase complex dimerization subunit type 1 TsaB n=1 Tax=Allokutzneria sp. NRRL B-24872 TaxID=1137961 RepID=UPI000A3847E3|nr:tRNA (adenosine(37)-N6)-threonylcarbamoyltransferase complex dimerization subunit type 1 TsaB [Allokutzneria sp. NRRL B-24872]